jgi:hypothetical protein
MRRTSKNYSTTEEAQCQNYAYWLLTPDRGRSSGDEGARCSRKLKETDGIERDLIGNNMRALTYFFEFSCDYWTKSTLLVIIS